MPRDLRRYAQRTTLQLIIGGLLILFLVGDGIIYVIYGPQAASLGLLCLGIGLFPIVLIVFFLFIIERIAKHD